MAGTPPPERKTARRKGVITKPKKEKAEAAARARGSDGKFESATNDENQDNPPVRRLAIFDQRGQP